MIIRVAIAQCSPSLSNWSRARLLHVLTTSVLDQIARCKSGFLFTSSLAHYAAHTLLRRRHRRHQHLHSAPHQQMGELSAPALLVGSRCRSAKSLAAAFL